MAVTPFDIANFNLIEFAKAYGDIFDSTPKNVGIQVMNDQGAVVTKTIANRGMFKQQIWDDVGRALGQFNRTFYVDAKNGNDNNNGSKSNPFKTISKAINSCPVGGNIFIVLLSDYTISSDQELIRFQNKKIYINGGNQSHSITINQNNAKNIFAGSGYIIFTSINKININFNYDTSTPIFWSTPIYSGEANSKLLQIIYTNINTVNLTDNSGTNTVKKLISTCDVDFTNNTFIINNTTIKLIEVSDTRFVLFNCSFKDSNGNNVSLSDYVIGIIKDSNGVPRNILSNVIF